MSTSIAIIGAPAGMGLLGAQGGATDLKDLRPALPGADTVIDAPGTRMDRKPTTPYTGFGRALLPWQAELGGTPVQRRKPALSAKG